MRSDSDCLPEDEPDNLASWAKRYVALTVDRVRSAEVREKNAADFDCIAGFFLASYGRDRNYICLCRDLLARRRAHFEQGMAPTAISNHAASLSAFFI